jgi:hypothetical protein
MPIDQVKIVSMCGYCFSEIETFTVKKDNLRLISDKVIWCEKCQARRPEVRDIAGRRAAILQEQESYPENRPAR